MRILSAARWATRHSLAAVLEAALIAIIVAVLLTAIAPVARPLSGFAGHADAGKPASGKPGGGGATSGGSLVMQLAADTDGNGSANWAESITYRVTTGATEPYVSTTCTQNGTLVLSSSAGYFADYTWPQARVVALKTDRWTGGAADCVGKLYVNARKGASVLATTSFHVNP